ncbi:hypothetical protein EBF04_24420 [Streptomyces sp. I6]|nr:hypothetical protein EBF04_24420 [Streptomyces sp. I6]
MSGSSGPARLRPVGPYGRGRDRRRPVRPVGPVGPVGPVRLSPSPRPGAVPVPPAGRRSVPR